MNTLFMIIFILLAVASTAAFIWIRVTHVGLQAFWAKLIASTFFLLGGIVAVMLKQNPANYLYFFVIGLFFGLIGDMLLDLKLVYRPHDKQYTNGGIISFTLAHICYIVGVILYACATKDILTATFVSVAIGSVLATIIIANSKSMGIDFSAHALPVTIYTFILTIDTVLAIALSFLIPTLWMLAGGLVLFLVSDLILSFIYWGNKNTNVMNILNLSFYYAAQIIIMAFLFI